LFQRPTLNVQHPTPNGRIVCWAQSPGYPLNTRNDAKKDEISGTIPAFAKASARQAEVVPPISRNWRVSRTPDLLLLANDRARKDSEQKITKRTKFVSNNLQSS